MVSQSLAVLVPRVPEPVQPLAPFAAVAVGSPPAEVPVVYGELHPAMQEPVVAAMVAFEGYARPLHRLRRRFFSEKQGHT